MEKLSERQKMVLSMVIHEYIHSASPVGSKNLVERYKMDVSSATVRNELAALTDMGYLQQPHTSAGRVPTEDGYRHFVERLQQVTDLPESVRRMISHQFYQTRHDVEQWARLAASVLATQSQAASVVTAPHPISAKFKHLELIATHGLQVLLVLVLYGGEVHQHVISMDEPATQEQLSEVSRTLTDRFRGMVSIEVERNLQELDGLSSLFADYILVNMRQTDSLSAGEVFMDGLTNVMAEPEFTGSNEVRRALHLLEERSLLNELLERTILPGTIGGVQVLIGGEGIFDELRQFSVILSSYGASGLSTGTIGVLGPMRMSYGRSISMVRFLSRLMSDLVVETLGDY
ncbi:MAG: heat-inducible transcription repressor HrcA [Anaerolineaceae bacterium]|nr:heat-inducible transcription repressor HrcA [Anaerolineaceae bacterium]